VALAGMAIAAVGAWRWLASRVNKDEAVPPGATILNFSAFSCQFVQPEPPWEIDDAGSIKRALKADLVLRRTAPNAWLALLMKDYKDQTPADGEVRDELLRRLANYFSKDSLEWEQQKDATLAGQLGQHLLFRGEVEDKAMTGEGFILVHQGLAYWLMGWAPAGEASREQAELDTLPRRFSLLPVQREWKEKRPAVQVFRGRLIGYTLRDPEGIWQQWTPATDYDPGAVLALVGHERPEPGAEEAPTKTVAATVLVLVLKHSAASLDAAVKAARLYLIAQQQAVYPDTRIEAIPDPKGAKSDHVGSATGQIQALHVINGETRQRFVLLGVVREPDKVLVLVGECAWNKRESWEPVFRRLLDTFQLSRSGEDQGGDEAEP
jgi:hypothetical protein